MKFILVADPHARWTAEGPERMIDGLPAPMFDFMRMWGVVKETAEREQPVAVVVLGDLFHHRHVLGTQMLVMVIRALQSVKQPVILMAGNHDLAENEQRISSIEAIPGIRPILQPHDQYFGTGPGRVFVRWIPYDRDEQRAEEAVRARDFAHGLVPDTGLPSNKTPAICFFHGMVRGARRGPWDYCGQTVGVPVGAFQRFTTFAGHVHRHQVLPPESGAEPVQYRDGGDTVLPPRGAFMYCGSPYALNVSQTGERNGIWVLDTADMSARRILVPGPQYREVTSYPEVEALFEQFEPHDVNLRVLLHDMKKAPEFEGLSGLCRSFCIRPIVQAAVVTGDRAAVAAASTEAGAVQAYVEAACPELGRFHQTALVKAGLEFLQEVEGTAVQRHGSQGNQQVYCSRLMADNFLSLGHVDVPFAGPGLFSIEGPNGVGKSAFMEILGFCLFGKTARGQRGMDAVNERAPDDKRFVQAAVELSRDGQLVGRVKRYVSSCGTAVEGQLFGQTITGDTPTDRQQQLEMLLGIDWEGWRAAQHFTDDYCFLLAGDDDKNRALDALTGTHRYEKARKVADRVERQAGALQQAGAQELHALQVKRQAGAQILRAALEHQGHARGVDEARVAALEREAQELRAAAADDQRVVQQWDGYCAGQQQLVAGLEQQVRAAEDAAGPDPRGRLQDLEQRQRAAYGMIDKAAKDLAAAQQGVCPTCNRPGMELQATEYLRQLYDGAVQEYGSLTATVDAVRGAAARWQEAGQQIAGLRQQLEAAKVAAVQGQHGYQAARTAVDQKLHLAADRHRTAQRMREEAGAAGAPVRIEELRSIQQHLRDHRKTSADQRVNSATADVAGFWRQEGFTRTGLKSYLRERDFPFLNERANEYVRRLSCGRRAILIAPTFINGKGEVEERITVTIFNAEGSSNLKWNSKGERATFELGMMLAFADLAAIRTGLRLPVALDEVFNSIDVTTLPVIAQFLHEQAETRQIWIASHHRELTDEIDAVLRIEGRDGVSRAVPSWVAGPAPLDAAQQEHADVSA